MQRDTARALVLAALALLAIGAAGASLDDPAASEGSGLGGGGGSGLGSGSGTPTPGVSENRTGNAGPPGSAQAFTQGACIQWLHGIDVKLGLLGAVVALAVLFWYKTNSKFVGAFTAVFYGSIVGILWVGFAGCWELSPNTVELGVAQVNETNQTNTTGGGGGLDQAAATAVDDPTILLGVVLALALAAAMVLLVASTADDDETVEREDEAPESDAGEPDVAAVGRVAGDAADRIEGTADVGNEVYRAWAEMTGHLDVAHPDASTPTEFAEAAEAAGMAPDDVRELTDLFERVRYGTDDATAERERRAVAALRRIETEYAGDAAGGGD